MDITAAAAAAADAAAVVAVATLLGQPLLPRITVWKVPLLQHLLMEWDADLHKAVWWQT